MPVLSSVQRGDIGPMTGAIQLHRIVVALPVSDEVGRKLKEGYGWFGGTEPDRSLLVSHPFLSPYTGENVQSDYRTRQTGSRGDAWRDRGHQRLSLFTAEHFEERFKPVPKNPLRFVDQEIVIWGQKMEADFDAILDGRTHVPAKAGSWLVQFYEPGKGISLAGFMAMQFAVEDEKFLWTHFRAQI